VTDNHRGKDPYLSDGLKIHIGSEADDAKLRVLEILCDLSLAATITSPTGSERGAILISASPDGLIVEEWNEENQAPSGQLTTLSLDTVAEISVT
jgi:hypothetical protein